MSARAEKRKWWILFAMTASLSMVYVDVSVLPVALPTLSRELNYSPIALQWIINVYTLTLTVFAMAGGKLAHRFGLKKSFCLGVLIFALASALCGLSNQEYQIILARVLQGMGASLMIPSQQAIILGTFPPHQRGKAVGILVSCSSLFLTLGPLVGGSLTQYLSWRYIFWVNLPIAVLGVAAAWLLLPRFPKHREAFDWFGFFTLGLGVTSLMIGIMHIQSWGLRSIFTWLLLLFGIGMIAFLCRAEQKSRFPLFDIALLRARSFIGGSLCTFFNAFLVMVTIYWAIFFQDILYFSPSQAGLLSCFAYAPIFFAAPLAGFLVDRYGPRLLVVCGFAAIAVALSLFIVICTQGILWTLLLSLFLFGMSLPFIFTPSFISLMDEVPAEKRGVASGMNSTLRQFSSTLGLAFFGTLFFQWHYWKFSQGLMRNASMRHLHPLSFEGLSSQKPSALHAVSKFPEPTAAFIQEQMLQSYISAFHLINVFAILCALAGLYAAWRFLKNKPLHKKG
ncbi:MAG TPA: MFS transporter [Rhabdochlamydiaceae bacterium]